MQWQSSEQSNCSQSISLSVPAHHESNLSSRPWTETSYNTTKDVDFNALLTFQDSFAGKVPQQIIDIIQRKDENNTLLLYGPEGAGKTKIIETLSAIRGASLLTLNGGNIVTRFQGSGAEVLTNFFAHARERSAAGENIVLFIDQVDAIFGQYPSKERRDALTYFGPLLKDAKTDQFILFAATTSRYDLLNPSFTSQIENHIKISLPDLQDRKAILLKLLAQESKCLTDTYITQLATSTENFSGRALEILLTNANRSKAILGETELLPIHIEENLPDCKKTTKIAMGNRKTFEQEAAGISADKEISQEKLFITRHSLKIIGVAGLALVYYFFQKEANAQIPYKTKITD